MRFASVILSAAVMVVVAGCSAHVDTRFVPTDELESEASAALEKEYGRAPDAMDCPDELPVRVGAEVRCVLTDGDERYGLTITLTEKRGNGKNGFSIAVDEDPLDAGS
ncbi:DUF4333 domain-containing protein [Cellulomonas chitinilytica]|uniref:DUF4333 domain-containing protein n=1 Tax=Cellulomonas chitinilytica TaxID=398759 RepID=UPI0019432267|nr:DUF4333 domain-containing protein [Cellulomonas chitinilytica]